MGEIAVSHNGYEHVTVGGIAAVYSPNPDDFAGDKVFTMLQAVQQRGVLASGIAIEAGGGNVDVIHSLGHVSDLGRFYLPGARSSVALGHVRSENIPDEGQYPEYLPYIQPVFESGGGKDFAFVANGHFGGILDASRSLGFDYKDAQLPTNAAFMARLIGNYADREGTALDIALSELLPLFEESPYAFGLITEGQLIAGMGDGIQPLVRGVNENGTVYVATETAALDMWQATAQQSFLPGETIIIDREGLRSNVSKVAGRVCIREFTDYALDHSRSNGIEINTIRQRVGASLAEEYPVENADLILGIPERGIPIALAYAKRLGVPHIDLVTKNRYHGGTPRPTDREGHIARVGSSYNLADPNSISGKVVVFVDNRMSTSETVRRVVDLANKAGAKEVHLRFATPLNDNSCEFGKHAEASMALDLSGVASIEYLSLDGLLGAVSPSTFSGDAVCTHCINGEQQVFVG